MKQKHPPHPLLYRLCKVPYFRRKIFAYVERGLSGGSLHPDERDRLKELCTRCGPNSVLVELGSLFGATARVMAGTLKGGSKVYAVDNFCWNLFGFSPEQHERLYRSLLAAELSSGQVVLFPKTAEEFFTSYRCRMRIPPGVAVPSISSPALVFIDAMHTYESVKADITGARSIAGPGTVICGHDYSEHWPGVMQAVNEAGGCASLVRSLWVLKR